MLLDKKGCDMKESSAVIKRRVDITLFFVVSVLFYISISAFDPYITPYANELKIPVSSIGIILSVAGFSSIIVRFPIGVFAEMFTRKKIMVQLGLMMTFAVWLVVFLFPSVGSLFMGKFADGVTGGTWVLYTVLFSTYFRNDDIPKAIGIIQLASTIGPFIGMNIGGMVSELFGYEYSFIVAVIAAGLGIVILFFIDEPDMAPAVNMQKAWSFGKQQLLDKNVWIFGLFASIAMMTTYAGRDLLTPLMAENLGGGAIALTILPNLFMIFNSIASILSGALFPKYFGLTKTIAIGAIGAGIVAVTMPFSPNLITLYVLQSFGGFFFGMNVTILLALVLMKVSNEVQTSRMGLYQSIYSIGLAIGPMIAGFILEETSLKITYFIMGTVVIIVGCFANKLLPSNMLNEKQV